MAEQKVQEQIILEFSKTVEMFDISPSEAKLFSLLYIEGKPMTLDEMADWLGKSKTSVSNGIRSLLDLNLVERVWIKGVRKDLYQADVNLYHKFMSNFIHKWLEAMKRQKKTLLEINDRLTSMKGKQELPNRLQDMIDFHQHLEKTFKEIKSS
ncbi:transcriptional regulator [Radiobacillus kanasensis]|uniref:GbsR/MarR family transcriptional regulator n=1 Tax=Radiobacillus kanasensis TaxID=2844358 RepID=UPI001E2AF2FF|nr:transcriptional regulator [Radiobacillus kanasensis]UFU00485.1 transcriptional regulator [Radiobacillus kanasensis]